MVVIAVAVSRPDFRIHALWVIQLKLIECGGVETQRMTLTLTSPVSRGERELGELVLPRQILPRPPQISLKVV